MDHEKIAERVRELRVIEESLKGATSYNMDQARQAIAIARKHLVQAATDRYKESLEEAPKRAPYECGIVGVR